MSNPSFNPHFQASMVGILKYSIKSIATFREVPFFVMHSVKNTGNVEFNELIIEENLQSGYKPPTTHDIKLLIEHPEKEVDKNSLIPEKDPFYWDTLENVVKIEEQMIEITPNNQDFVHAHKIQVKLTNLKASSMGIFAPRMIFRIIYPITAMKLVKDTVFKSKVRYLANTFPVGKPIECVPPPIQIPVEHVRRNFNKGKRVRALETAGQYEITLFLLNTGISPISEVEIKDNIPLNFRWEVITKEYKYKSRTDAGQDCLIWLVPIVQPNEKITICYRVIGTGEYKADDVQFA